MSLLNIGLGKTTILPPEGFTVKKIKETLGSITRNNINGIIASPSVVSALASLEDFNSANVQTIITGGGAVMPGEAGSVIRKFNHAQISVVYGSTEAEPVSHLDIIELAGTSSQTLLQKGLPVGKPDRIDLKIIQIHQGPVVATDEATLRSFEMKNNEPGEIIVSGPHVLEGYINNPDAVALNKIKVNDVVWHRTGDVGRLDADRNLYFLGRCNEVIVWKGRPIYPLILSVLLNRETGIREAAFILKKDALLLILEKQYVHMHQQVIEKLEAYGIRGVKTHFIRSVPKDPRHHTKIDYEALKKMI